MAKKIFATPFLFNPITPPPDVTDSGAGSGQGGQKPWLCNYATWCALSEYAVDLNKDDVVDEIDYQMWFKSVGGTIREWTELGNDASAWIPD